MLHSRFLPTFLAVLAHLVAPAGVFCLEADGTVHTEFAAGDCCLSERSSAPGVDQEADPSGDPGCSCVADVSLLDSAVLAAKDNSSAVSHHAQLASDPSVFPARSQVSAVARTAARLPAVYQPTRNIVLLR